jgi:hypothetical protein
VTIVIVYWVLSALALVAAAAWAGHTVTTSKNWLGILIDSRGRYSLTHLQLVLWTIVVLSLITAVVLGRLTGGSAAKTLDFTIPNNLLLAVGISVGSAVAATATKAGKDSNDKAKVERMTDGKSPRISQVFMVEEGAMADKAVDVTKFQNFWLTLIIVGSYVATAGVYLLRATDATQLSPPDFSQQVVTLLGISHAGYIAAKVPNKP